MEGHRRVVSRRDWRRWVEANDQFGRQEVTYDEGPLKGGGGTISSSLEIGT